MTLTFDLAEDELQIYLSETDEHLQTLDEGFVRLEHESDDPELLQAIFRAAHTLKGSAGMIGHKRMAELTHALETVLDSLRKRTLSITVTQVDLCLEVLDALKLLRNEILDGQPSPVDVDSLVTRLLDLQGAVPAPAAPALPVEVVATTRAVPQPPARRAQPKKSTGKTKSRVTASHTKSKASKKASSKASTKRSAKTVATSRAKAIQPVPSQEPDPISMPAISIKAEIAPDSIASAARAFQILMALQSLGTVLDLQPSQADIELAKPVHTVTARLQTDHPVADIQKALSNISEVAHLTIGEAEIDLIEVIPLKHVAEPGHVEKLGEFLVQTGIITADQLQLALTEQARTDGPATPLGQTLVRLGLVSQKLLDQAVSQHETNRIAETASLEKTKGRTAERTVRTSVERLDNLMNLVGELITDRNRLSQLRLSYEQRFRGDDHVENLAQTAIHIGRITDQLQEEVMRIRMQPVATVFSKFPRLLRDLSRKANKQAELVIRGEDTELDRTVIEEISDPLIHLIRNSVDHGLESPDVRIAAGKPARGTLLLTARHEESHIILTVEDDGRGIDPAALKAKAVQRGVLKQAEADALTHDEAIDLIFQPGLSTAKVITDISGRGVGMDIVRANVERLNGVVTVETWPGKGTRIQIVLPLTLAIVPALLVSVNGGTFAIPLAAVMEALHVPVATIHTVNNCPVIRLRERVLPLARLSETLALAPVTTGTAPARTHEYVVAVQWARTEMGLMVDHLIGEQELVIKSLGPVVGDAPGVSGAAILGDGQVALILDIPGLFRLAGLHKQRGVL